MRLATFIENEKESILEEAVKFARTIAVFSDAAESALRDHLPEILQDISDDLRTHQSESASIAKSLGTAAVDPSSDAVFHGRQRALAGLQIDQVIAEYRALRSSVLRLWGANTQIEQGYLEDIGRFNEAVDQAIAESVGAFAEEVEKRRQIFLAAVGHDLRGPLQAIVLTADAVSNKCPPALGIYTNILKRSAARMSGLLDSLLDYNLVGLGGAMRLNLSEAHLDKECAEEVSILQAAFPEAEIEMTCAGNCHGNFDISRIREALGNLVTNAVKYGVSAKPIRVAVCGEDDAVKISVTNAVARQIPNADLARLFDPLRRGSDGAHSEGRASLGLGLFITKEIVEAHGGTATASSTDHAIMFTLNLPRLENTQI